MTSYTNIFGGSPVQPSEVSYIKYVVTADIQLNWSTSFVDSPNIASHIIELNTAAGVFDITLPDAREVSVGQDILFVNLGTNDANLRMNDGTLLEILQPAEVKYFYLTDNSTQNGTWTGILFGGGVVQVYSIGAVSLTPTALTIASTTTNPITTNGTFQFTIAPSLVAIANLGAGPGTGIVVQTGVDTFVNRTLQQGANILIANGSGVAGDPTIGVNPVMTNLTSIQVGNMSLAGNTLSTTGGNNPILLSPNGTGYVGIVNNTNAVPLRWYNAAGTHYVAFQAGALVADTTWTLPLADGTVNQALVTNGAGVLSWATVGGGGGGAVDSITGTVNQIVADMPTGNVTLSLDNDVIIPTSMKAGNIKLLGNVISSENVNGNVQITPNGTGVLQSDHDIVIQSANAIKFNNAGNTFSVGFRGPNAAANLVWTLPLTDGAAGQAMVTDGAGVLSWATTPVANLQVNQGGTGVVMFTPYEVICGGTTPTNPLQQVAGTGAAGEVLTSNGAGVLPTWQPSGAGGGGLPQRQIYTSSGTFNVPAGVTRIFVEAYGGGGGCTTGTGLNAGGGGAYCDAMQTVVPLSVIPVVVGAGGLANTATPLGSGGASTFNGLSAGGGAGANLSVGPGSVGGVATGGDININGSGSGYFRMLPTITGMDSYVPGSTAGRYGGTAMVGVPASGLITSAQIYGAGANTYNNGNGAQGLVVVWW